MPYNQLAYIVDVYVHEHMCTCTCECARVWTLPKTRKTWHAEEAVEEQCEPP